MKIQKNTFQYLEGLSGRNALEDWRQDGRELGTGKEAPGVRY